MKVFLCKEAWPVVSMKLLSTVQSGHRPTIPDDSPQYIAQLIEKCWKAKPIERPNISEISQQLEGYLEEIHSNNFIDQGAPAMDTNECLDMPPTSSSFDDSIMNEATTSNDGLACQDTTVKRTSECFLVASTTGSLASEFNSSSTIDDNTLELDLEVDTGLDTSGDNSNSGMSSCANFQPIVNAQLSQSNSIPATENERNSHNSTHDDHRHIAHAEMQKVKDVLKITELKQFQIECATAVIHGHDAIVVQPTGCGKSLCFIIPAIYFPGKVSLVVEPAVSVITNQVDSLQK